MELQEWASIQVCNNTFVRAIVAECQTNNLVALAHTDGLHAVADFYDAATGAFVAQRSWSDALDETCWGMNYWPLAVDCDEAIVTEVLCGTRWAVGDIADLRRFW